MRENPDYENKELLAFRRDLQVLNPLYEDKECYSIEDCIQEAGRKPYFGFPVTKILDDKQEEEEGKKSVQIEMMKPIIYTQRREKNIMDHVMKCFTFGKPVRRTEPLETDTASRTEDVKKRFNRIRLIRNFHSIKRRDKNRKFDNPLD